LREVDLPQNVFDIIAASISVDPTKRLLNAEILLTELDKIHDRRKVEWAPKETLYLLSCNNWVLFFVAHGICLLPGTASINVPWLVLAPRSVSLYFTLTARKLLDRYFD
jgi:hypothetical protein